MPETRVESNGKEVTLAYIDEGKGPAVLLVHGFASTKEVNWVNPGWVRRLVGEGHRVIAFDNRGHGASSKMHEPGDYTLTAMSGDAMALLRRLDVQDADIVGYSMGARIAASMAIRHGTELGRFVLSGNGWVMTRGSDNWEAVRDALLAPRPEEIADPAARAYRTFAQQTGSDLKALAACACMLEEPVAESGLRGIRNEVLVAVGTEDQSAGSGEKLAQILQNGRFLSIPGRDHMRAVGDKVHMDGVVEFLAK